MSLGEKDHLAENLNTHEKKYALIVGVDTAIEVSTRPLRYAESDAVGIEWLLGREESNFAFPSPVLIGEVARTANVRQALDHLIEHSSSEDFLLFYFIGYSYPVLNRQGAVMDISLVTADFDPRRVQVAPADYLSLRQIQRLFFEHNQAASVLMILDCYAAGSAPAVSVPLDYQARAIQQRLDELRKSAWVEKRDWAVITSLRTEVSGRGEEHSRVTGLFLSALGGKNHAILEGKDLTLYSLCEYFKTEPRQERGQFLCMEGSVLGRQWIIAKDPARNPVMTTPGDFEPQTENRSSLRQGPASSPFFDESICEKATFEDLDFAQVRAFLQKARVRLQQDYRPGLDEQEQMRELEMLAGPHPSYGALLCFGSRPTHYVPGAYTECTYWKGSNRRGDQISKQIYRESLLSQFTSASAFLQQNLHFSRVIDYGGSSEQPEIPFRVLEEILANALVHREYDSQTRVSFVQVDVFIDRVEIRSPGGPPEPLSADALRNASEKHTGSHARNPQIIRIFYLAGYVEKVGSGIERVQHWMKEAKLRPPEISLDPQTGTLTVVLFRPDEKIAQPTPPGAGQLQKQQNQSGVDFFVAQEKVAQPTPYLLPKPEDEVSLPVPLSVAPPPIDVTEVPLRQLVPSRPRALVVPAPMQRRRWVQSVLFLLLALLIIAGGVLAVPGIARVWQSLHSNSTVLPPAQASTEIDIASDFPTSGENTLSGLPLQYGAQMAINQANSEHLLPGYTLALVKYDDVGRNNRYDPQKGKQNIQDAVARPLIAGIVGPSNSSVAVTELPIANQAPIAILSPDVTNPCLTKNASQDANCSGQYNILAQLRPTGRLTFYRVVTTDDIQGKTAADYFFQSKGFRRAVVLKDDSDAYSAGLSRAFIQEWEHLGGQDIPLGLSLATSSVQDYQNALQGIVSTQPDLIYFTGSDPNGAYALQAQANIPALKNVPFVGADGITDSDFLQNAATLLPTAPVYASLPIVDPAHSGTKVGSDFQIDYTDFVASQYNTSNNYYRQYAASAYDCVMILIQAIKAALQTGVSTPHGNQDMAGARTFRQAVLDALAGISYTGATGTQSFDSNGDTINRTVSFYQLNITSGQASWTWLTQISK